MSVVVKSFNNSVVKVVGSNLPKIQVRNSGDKIKIVQSVSPIPLTSGGNTLIDGGNF